MLIDPTTTTILTPLMNSNSSDFLDNNITNTATNFSAMFPITTASTTTASAFSDLNELIFNSNKNYTYLDNFVRANCFLPFYFIEIMHSAVQILLGVNIFE
jgi:hypothetical protein